MRLFASKLYKVVVEQPVEHLQDRLSVFVLKTQVLYLYKWNLCNHEALLLQLPHYGIY